MTQELPEGTVTFLFSDVEGSTALVNALGDRRFADVLEEHHAVIRKAIAAHGGAEVSTAGDGFFVAFESPAASVAAAVDAQIALADTTWPHGATVRVRMGIHTGDALLASTGYVGLAVHEAARIAAAGHGGQVLVSARTASLVAGEFGGDASFLSLGRHRLKDLAEAQELYQLCHPRLSTEFPPLKSLNEKTTNLPAQLTSFVGRGDELEEVAALVEAHRLVTLVGAGGSGKTRLAIQVAGELADRFPDGVWFVELAPIADGVMIPSAIAAVMGVVAEGRVVTDAIAEYTRGKKVLLVLDNCEHLIFDAATVASALVRANPDLHLLLTSREALTVTGETVWRVPSLQADPAVELFCERARQVAPAFAPSRHDIDAIATICVRLDGMPLALELAAARARVLSVAEIAGRLDDRFRLLTGGSRAALARQQTLHATVAWSYDLLTDAERAALARLAVFAGGFGVEAAEAVIADDMIEATDVFDLVTSLTDKSLVVAEPSADGTRYRLLETIRHFARQKLFDLGETERLRRAHLAWATAFAERAAPELVSWDQAGWLDRVEIERDNMFAALEWAAGDAPSLHSGLRLAAALHHFFLRRAYLTDGRRLTQPLLDQAGGDAPYEAHYESLLAMSDYIGHQESRFDDHYPNEMLRLAESKGNAADAARARFWIAWRDLRSRWNSGAATATPAELEAAFAAADEMRGLAAPGALANTLLHAGRLFVYDSGIIARSRAYAEEALEIATAAGDLWNVGAAQITLANLARASGDLDAARTYYRDCLDLSRRLGFTVGVVHGLGGLLHFTAAEGDLETLDVMLPEFLDAASRVGDAGNRVVHLVNLALALRAHDAEDRANDLVRMAAEAATSSVNVSPPLVSVALFLAAEVARTTGDRAAAERAIDAYERSAPQGDVDKFASTTDALRGELARAHGDLDAAHRYFVASVKAATDDHDRNRAIPGLAMVAYARGDRVRAAQLFGCTSRLETDVPPPWSEAAARAAAVENLRKALGETEFAAAWAAGAAFTATDVLAQESRPNL